METRRRPRERRLPGGPTHSAGIGVFDPVRPRPHVGLPRLDASLLVVADIETAHDELVAAGVDVSEVFHDATGGYNRFDHDLRASGPDPQRRTYASFVRSATRTGTSGSCRRSPHDCPAGSTRRRPRSAPSGIWRARSGGWRPPGQHEDASAADKNWPDWYAAYMVAEQSGDELPT